MQTEWKKMKYLISINVRWWKFKINYANYTAKFTLFDVLNKKQ